MKGEGQHIPLTPNEGGGEYAAGNAAGATRGQKRARTIHIGVVLFFLINIIVLYVLHFADRGHSTSTNAGSAIAGAFTTSSLTAGAATESASVSKGHAVSFAANGKLVKGAGTTAYLAAATLPADQKSIARIHFTPLGTSKTVYNTNVMTYLQGVAPNLETVVTTVSKAADKKELTIAAPVAANVIKGSTIKDLTTLSDTLAIAVATTTGADGLSTMVDVYPITIATDASVTLGAKTFAVNNSATNFVARVSATSFAIAYYDAYTADAAYFQRIKVGSVADGKVEFSKDVVFGKGNSDASSTTIGRPQPVFNSSDRFTVPWFVEASSASKNGTADAPVGLCLTTASFSAANLSTSADVCNTNYQPAYFIDSTQLTETVIALIFFDRANNFALTVAVVEFSAMTGAPTFRSSFVITEASGKFDFGSSMGFYPQPTIQALSDNRVAIGFLNPSNSGKPSIKVLKYTSDLSMVDASPVLPVSNKDFTVATADPKAYGAIVLDMQPLETGFMLSYAGSWAGTQYKRVVLVESLGKPVGVVSKTDGSDISVATSGTVETSVGLESGTTYYAATDGSLYAPTTTTNDDYVLVNDNNVVISKDARVGVAVGSKKLFVTAN